ncbi:hypothetical protein Tco_0751519 [Tanacetum coccineum]|uniref:Uncharacterized protein n=1 Tax=Tanacetum coccineum TaxID=301880 RepID=A0ABQ4Z7S2_9ASTR
MVSGIKGSEFSFTPSTGWVNLVPVMNKAIWGVVMDVENVEEWVVWVKPKAFYAQPMVFEEDDQKLGSVEWGWKKILLPYGKRPRTPLREGLTSSFCLKGSETKNEGFYIKVKGVGLGIRLLGGGKTGLDGLYFYTTDIGYGWGDAFATK